MTRPGTPPLGRYSIDTRASTISFRTRHLFGLAPVTGTFAIRGGTVDVAEPVTASRVRVEIDAASFRTRSAQRDRVVRSARFLDTDRYPVMEFTSGGPDGSTLTGTLTVHGTSQQVSMTLGEPANITPESFTVPARLRVDRFEFGVTASRGMAGRHLEVAMEITCVRS